jgi:Ca2+-transporting ATPase
VHCTPVSPSKGDEHDLRFARPHPVSQAYNYRSDRHSVFRRPFANKWLNLAIFWELFLLFLVVTVPFLESAFGTSSLTVSEWILLAAAAFTVVPVIEIGKWMVRRGMFGKDD